MMPEVCTGSAVLLTYVLLIQALPTPPPSAS